MENNFWAPGTDFFCRIYAIYSTGQSNTPMESSECSPEFFESFLEQFSVSPKSCVAWLLVHTANRLSFSVGSKIILCIRTGAGNSDSLQTLGEKSCCSQNRQSIWTNCQTTTLEKRKTAQENFLITRGGILWKIYRCFWQSRRINRGFSAEKKSS